MNLAHAYLIISFLGRGGQGWGTVNADNIELPYHFLPPNPWSPVRYRPQRPLNPPPRSPSHLRSGAFTSVNEQANLTKLNHLTNIRMATSQSGQSDELSLPPFWWCKPLGRGLFSPATERLFWPLDGVFPASISVMKTPRSPNDLEPFFQPDTTGSGTGTWHEISQLPLTKAKVSSIEASVSDLDQWEFDWIEWHRDHTAPEFDQEYVTYGDLSDEDRPWADADQPNEDGSWEEDSDTEFLIKCCGEDRPLRKRGLKLVVTPSAGKDFVTVYDYVSGKCPF